MTLWNRFFSLFRNSDLPAFEATPPRPDRSAEIVALTDRGEEEIRSNICSYEIDEIRRSLAHDRWLANYLVNIWESENQSIELSSFPTGVALPISDVCNARCTFCSSWLEGSKLLTIDKLAPYLEVLPYARLIGFQGHGEPLANPQIEQILERIGEIVDPRAQGYIISNGAFLGKHLDRLLKSRITIFNLSLNSVTPETHNVVMGLGPDALPPIIETVKRIVAIRDAGRSDIQVTISMVMTVDNIHEAARFVELGNELRVNQIFLRTLMPMQDPWHLIPRLLNYHRQSPVRHPDFERHAAEARASVEASKVPIETYPDTWASDVVASDQKEALGALPAVSREEAIADKEIRRMVRSGKSELQQQIGKFISEVHDLTSNPYGRSAPFKCNFIYNQLITTKLTFEMYPCCYLTHVPGHESVVLSKDRPFMAHWNSDALKNIRRRLREGPLFQACATCPMQG